MGYLNRKAILPLILISICLLIACREAVPPEPVQIPTMALAILEPTELPTRTPAPTMTPNLAATLTALPTPTATIPGTPTPISSGSIVDPSTIRATPRPVSIPLDLDPNDDEVESRPPPLPVPLAIHPDDHYWLARPIPSGSRNYDLAWYPYGNDVLIEALAPYRVHHGLDFPNEPGTAVLAAGDGRVVWAGPRPSPRNGINYYGNTVIIEHSWQWEGQPVYTLYAHTLELFVDVGDRVRQGQLLAGVGGSGQVSGTHLHFEVRVGGNGYFNTRNPSLWIAPYEGWGTLAGRLIDRLGQPIPGADLTVIPLETQIDAPIRRQKTYVDPRLLPDEVWQENFVVADLPAGTYRVEAEVIPEPGLLQSYVNEIEILPGQTNFLLIQADTIFIPTPTPVITSTFGITTTIGITDSLNPEEE